LMSKQTRWLTNSLDSAGLSADLFLDLIYGQALVA
jgi:hypothetical protein